MSNSFSIYQVDAFADTLFKGNPAAVCPLDKWIPDEKMQKIANENNLAETAFFVKEAEHYHIRWFTPTVEVALCGHATVATAHVMVQHLGIKDNPISFTCQSGNITVRLEKDLYILNFPSDYLTATEAPENLIQCLKVKPLEIYKGKYDYLVVLETEQQVKAIQPNWNDLALVETRGIIVTAPGTESDFASRFFAPRAGINEDPVTGSAHTTLVPYWSKKFNKTTLLAKQVSERGGTLYCQDLGDRTEIGGKAVTYLQGTLFI